MKAEKKPIADTLIEYQSEPKDLGLLSGERSIRIYFLMRLINEFERRVIELKRSDCVWGPIHISIGQEAVAAATIAAIDKKDRIAGSHRAHHVFLAKALQYVLPDDWRAESGSIPAEAQDVVNRTLAEIMGLSPGFCGGRGGSMHLRWIEGGILGTNAIVAGGVPLSAGAAFAEQYRGSGKVVVCYLGDGAVNQGSFHEACNLAGLWNLPVLYVIENNQYAVATPARDACAIEDLAQHALSYSMSGSVAYGYDPVGIYSATHEMVSAIRKGGRPGILELKCYRHLHHGGDLAGSAYGYRAKDEEGEWLSRDALATFPALMKETKLIGAAELEAVESLAAKSADEALDFCAVREDERDGVAQFSVRSELWPSAESVRLGVRGDGKELQSLPYRERSDFDSFVDSKYSDAIAAVTGRWLERDDGVVVFGEEVANFGGGAYGATKGLPKRFPSRVKNTPISECGFSGLGLGMAMSGMRPVVEIMFPDFTLVAADQIFNQIGKARHMYGGSTDLPLVLRTRIATGCGYGGQHSMDPVGLYALFPGWRIIAPSDAFEYIGLFNTAMHSLDPVVVLEHHSLYEGVTAIPTEDLDYCIPFGKARIALPGSDCTVITYGSMTGRLIGIAEVLAQRLIHIEVIDLRTLDFANIDYATIADSVCRTGLVAIFEQAAEGQAIGMRLVKEVTERTFDYLDGPPGAFTALDIPNPVSRVLEAEAMLDDDQIATAVTSIVERRWR